MRKKERERGCIREKRMKERKRESVCVRKREREKERECVCVHKREREEQGFRTEFRIAVEIAFFTFEENCQLLK